MLNHSKIYTVHLNPGLAFPEEQLELVREGATLWGFVFHGLWLLYHRCWFWGLAATLGYMLVVGGGEYIGLSTPAIMACELFIRLLVAFEGQDLRRASLARRGYLLADIIAAPGAQQAQRSFFHRWLVSGELKPAPLVR